MTNTNFYKNHTYNNLEIAICIEDVDNNDTGKFFIPALTPFLESDAPYDKKDPPYPLSNIISGSKNMDISPCITSNYIELELPDSVFELNKGDKFVISFIGGDINKPYIIGRYKR